MAPSRIVRLALVAAGPVGLLLSVLMVCSGSRAAFVAATANPGNVFSAGTVTLTDDDSGTALLTATGLEPGGAVQNCIQVSYGGSVPAAVKVYIAPGGLAGTGLGTYLKLKIEEGAGGGFGSCTGFVADSTDYTGTVAAFAAASTSAATGVGAFAPSGAGASQVYRVTATLADDDAARGLTAQLAFTWTAVSQ
jgi:hypothetical protein